jgi:hypothetical protein
MLAVTRLPFIYGRCTGGSYGITVLIINTGDRLLFLLFFLFFS